MILWATIIAIPALAANTGKTLATEPAAKPKLPLAMQLQATVDDYLRKRRDAEKITGISAYISLGKRGPDIAIVSGKTGLGQKTPIAPGTLFQIGSNTKLFTAVLIMKLEAEGKLSIDQAIGKWLPRYSAWKNVTIRQLLNMTSGIPNYSETLALSHATGRNPNRHWTAGQLIAFAYPSPTNKLPPNTGWFYSNTNYILAGLIIEKITGMSYGDALRKYIFEPVGLHETYYAAKAYPVAITRRMASGYFHNTQCEFYAPDCKASGLLPIIGRDLKTADVSWAGAAGGIVSSPRDLARWIRALFGGHVLDKPQLQHLQAIVSTKTGKPIADVSKSDPRGFGLGPVRMIRPGIGRFWFYEGQTLGYRTVFGWFPKDDLVITFSINSQPEPKADKIGWLIGNMHKLVITARQSK